MLIHAKWPEPNVQPEAGASGEINWLISVIDAVRSARADNQIPPAAKLSVIVAEANADTLGRIERNQAAISKIARIEQWQISGERSGTGGIQIVVGEATYTLDYQSTIDPGVERARLTAAIAAITKERDSLASRLNNPAFVEKARADHGDKAAEVERLSAALARLG